MNEIIFQRIKSTSDGVGATSGKSMEEAFNENFTTAKDLFESLFSIASIQITSSNIRQIKLNSEDNELYYSLDDESVASPTWVKIVNLDFSKISGNPYSNISLKSALDSKADLTDFNLLSNTVSDHETRISNLTGEVTDAEQNIGTLQSSVGTLQSQYADTVKTSHGDTLYIRYVSNLNVVEYSTDGSTWHNISTGQVAFSEITGDPSTNLALVDYITLRLSNAMSGYAPLSSFNDHVNARNNPHQVTKAQVGLGNVENYSPANMPLSTEASARFAAIEQMYPKFDYVNINEYLDPTFVTTPDYIYLVSNYYQQSNNGGGN